MNTKQAAADLRALLKSKGWNARQVSVRTDFYSMGSSIYVTVRDASIRLSDIEELSRAAEVVHRDEGTGEILCGGNRFVHVQYTPAAREALVLRHVGEVDDAIAALATLPRECSELVRIAGTRCLLGRDRFNGSIQVWDAQGRPSMHAEDASTIAYHVALYEMVGAQEVQP